MYFTFYFLIYFIILDLSDIIWLKKSRTYEFIYTFIKKRKEKICLNHYGLGMGSFF